MTRFIIVDQNATGNGGHHLGYVRCVAEAAQQRGLAVHWLCHQALVQDNDTQTLAVSSVASHPIKIHPTYRLTSGEADARGLPLFGPGHIVYDTEKALHRLRIAAGDHVLVPTVGLLELEAWLHHWLAMPARELAKMPFFHLLLRFDPTEIEQDCSAVWGGLRRRLQQRQHDVGQFLHCCADTEPLAVRYSQRLGLKVSIAPIPFDCTPLLAALRLPRGPIGRPLTLLYLGDARPEKGFAALPGLVEALWSGYLHSGKVRLVVQANLNVPGGQGTTPDVITALARCKGVELLLEPLTAAAYYQQLALADIVLLPYTLPNYQARSSGILVEALAAGKPVVTRTGTWLASQVRPAQAALINTDAELGSAVKALLARLPAAKRAAQRQAEHWRAFSAPTHYLDHLLAHVADAGICISAGGVLPVAQEPPDPVVQKLLCAWLGHVDAVATTLHDEGWPRLLILPSDNLSIQLAQALPTVLNNAIADGVPDAVKAQLLIQPQPFLAHLPVIGGLLPPITEHSQQRVHTQVILNGALQNTLVVQLRSDATSDLVAPIVLQDGRIVPLLMNQIQAGNAVFFYDIGPDGKYPYLQLSDLILQLPSDSCWNWRSILINEKLTVAMMRRSWWSRRCWHEIENEAAHAFAWSATPDIVWQWPSWRGVDKLVLLEAVSFRQNQCANLTFTLDGISYPLQATEPEGPLTTILPKKTNWPFSAHAKLHCDYFGQASVSDLRNIGIAMQQLVLVQKVF